MHLCPAAYVISQFQGVRKTARAIGRHPTAVSQWKRSREAGGGGGDVPLGSFKKILEKAKELGLDITAHDLIYGREVPDAPAKEAV